MQKQLKRAINACLRIVFKLFFRMSNNMENDRDYFSLDFYRNIVGEKAVFDPAKLLDIAAIYGQSNHKQVKNLIQNVFELEPKLLLDFKDSFDMMQNILKKVFKDALRTDQMIKGDAILQKTRSEQDEIILRLVHNLLEMLGNFQLITVHFGAQTIELIANTNFMVYIVNSYCLLRKAEKFWMADCTSEKMKAGIHSSIKIGTGLCIDSLAQVIGQGILLRINQHTKNYAIVQNKLGQTLKQFLLTITGNAEMSKDVLHKQINFICQSENDSQDLFLYQGKNYASSLMRHVSRRNINLKQGIQELEERFMGQADKDFLCIIIDSMIRGQKVQVKKVQTMAKNQALKDA